MADTILLPDDEGLNPVTFAMCGPICDHDFHGPSSYERNVDDGEGRIVGAERVCGKCGIGAMATGE